MEPQHQVLPYLTMSLTCRLYQDHQAEEVPQSWNRIPQQPTNQWINQQEEEVPQVEDILDLRVTQVHQDPRETLGGMV